MSFKNKFHFFVALPLTPQSAPTNCPDVLPWGYFTAASPSINYPRAAFVESSRWRWMACGLFIISSFNRHGTAPNPFALGDCP